MIEKKIFLFSKEIFQIALILAILTPVLFQLSDLQEFLYELLSHDFIPAIGTFLNMLSKAMITKCAHSVDVGNSSASDGEKCERAPIHPANHCLRAMTRPCPL